MISAQTSRGANAERARAHNRRLVLGRIRARGPMGRAEIARASGLSTQAVSNIVEGLEADGLLAPIGAVRAGRGLPAMQYGLNPSGGYAIGLELRPDAILGAALDLSGAPVATARAAMDDPAPGPAAAQAAGIAARLVADLGAAPLLGAGVALPGPFGPTGLAPEGGELPGWAEIDAQAHLSAALGLPVLVTRDAAAAAMAEHVGGAAKGLQTYAHLYFGAGIGLALVSNGEVLTGAHGNAGEIGRLPVLGGTLEGAASRMSLAARLGADGAPATSVAAIARHVADGHPVIDAWLRGAIPALAAAIDMVEAMADPETVVLGGAMPRDLMDRLTAEITLSGASVSARPDRTLPRITLGRCGPTVAAEGAAALVLGGADAPVRSLQAAE